MSDVKKRDKLLGAQVTEDECERIQTQAAAENRSVSSYLRIAALERIDDQIDETLTLLVDIRERLNVLLERSEQCSE